MAAIAEMSGEAKDRIKDFLKRRAAKVLRAPFPQEEEASASPTGDQPQPRRRMKRAHQQIHRDHSAERRPKMRRRAEPLRLAARRRHERHDREGRRGREAEPLGGRSSDCRAVVTTAPAAGRVGVASL
jgi:hypothetical protein